MKKCLTPGEQGVREASGSATVEVTGGSVCTLKIGPAQTHTHSHTENSVELPFYVHVVLEILPNRNTPAKGAFWFEAAV